MDHTKTLLGNLTDIYAPPTVAHSDPDLSRKYAKDTALKRLKECLKVTKRA